MWLVRGRPLLKCCPEQLRRTSAREELLESLAQRSQHEAAPPWTFHRVVEEIGGNRYEDAFREAPSTSEWHRAQHPDEGITPPRFRMRGKRSGPEQAEDEDMEEPEAATRPRTNGPTSSGGTAALA